MPTRPKRACQHHGCPASTDGAYCTEHAKAHTRKAWASVTTSSGDRGYGAAWRELRQRILNRDPVCCICNREPAKAVDHIRPKAQGGTDDDDNLQGVCWDCHARKTATEAKAGRRARRR